MNNLSFSDNLNQNPLAASAIKLAVEYLFPWPEIQFAAGQEGAASALSALLPAAVKSVPSRNLAKNTAMRLVLGRDFAGDRTALWLDPEAGDMNRRVAVVAPP